MIRRVQIQVEKGAFGKSGRRAQRASAHRQIRDDVFRSSLRSNDDGRDMGGKTFELSLIGRDHAVAGADRKAAISMGAQLTSKGMDREEIEKALEQARSADPANEFRMALLALWLHQISR